MGDRLFLGITVKLQAIILHHFYVHSPAELQYNILIIKTDGPMVYNRSKHFETNTKILNNGRINIHASHSNLVH